MNKLVGKIRGAERLEGIIEDRGLRITADIKASGPRGQKGDDGRSAYETWLELGNEGTKEEFFKSSNGTTNYEFLENKPSIENIEIVGNKSFKDLGMEKINKEDITRLI